MHVTGLLKLGVHFGYGAAGGADLLFHPARYLMSLGACKASKKILKAFAKGKNLSAFCKKKEIGSEATGFLLEELLERFAVHLVRRIAKPGSLLPLTSQSAGPDHFAPLRSCSDWRDYLHGN